MRILILSFLFIPFLLNGMEEILPLDDTIAVEQNLLRFEGAGEKAILAMVKRLMLEAAPTPDPLVIPPNLSSLERYEYRINSLSKLQLAQRISTLFTLLGEQPSTPPFINGIDEVICEETLRELDVLVGTHSDPQHALATKINRTMLNIGHATLCRHLVQIKDPSKLKWLQRIVTFLSTTPWLLKKMREFLSEASLAEDTFLSFWIDREPLTEYVKHQKCQLAIQSLADWVNSNDTILGFKQLSNIAMPFVGSAMGIGTLGYGLITRNIRSIVPGIYFTVSDGLQYEQKIESIKFTLLNLLLMQKRLIAIAHFIDAIQKLYELCENILPDKLIDTLIIKPEMAEIRELLSTSTFQDMPSLFSHWGRIVHAYRLMAEKKELLINTYKALGTIDFLVSLATLIGESTNKRPFQKVHYYSFTNKLVVQFDDGYSPLIKVKDELVTNTVDFGMTNPRNALTTGPNAKGKTSVLRTIGAISLFGSTIGFAPARRAVIPANLNILTSINISDDPSQGLSLFQAEVKRFSAILSTIRADPKRPCLIIADEPFSGTRLETAEDTAYIYLEFFAQEVNSMTVVTSHITSLADLEQNHSTLFKNYHVASGFRFIPGLDNSQNYNDVAADIISQFSCDPNLVASLLRRQAMRNSAQTANVSNDNQEKKAYGRPREIRDQKTGRIYLVQDEPRNAVFYFNIKSDDKCKVNQDDDDLYG